MDVGPDTYAGPDSTGVAERLRTREPDALDSFLRSWAGAVHRYCDAVCEPDLILEATAIAFADFFQKVETHPIDDAHLEPALMRSTRLAAGEAALVDEEQSGPRGSGEATFRCETTPLFLAGSPRAPVGVGALERMHDHVGSCPRCQATEARFAVAQDRFLAARQDKVPDEVLEAVLGIVAIPQEQADSEGGARRQKPAAKEAARARETARDRSDRLLERAEQEAETIRRDARRDAEAIRREAVADAERLMGRLQALEFPLGELVADLRDETERVTKQIESKSDHMNRLPPGEESSRASEPEGRGMEDRAGAAEPVSQEAVAAADDLQAAGWESGTTPAEPKKRGFLRRRRTKRPQGTFITVEGSCAICRRGFMAGSEEALARSGWRVSGEVGLCPDCQTKGWQLSEGARVPFRRRES